MPKIGLQAQGGRSSLSPGRIHWMRRWTEWIPPPKNILATMPTMMTFLLQSFIKIKFVITHFFYWQLFFRRFEPRILEKSSNLKATFEPHIEEVKQLSFKMTYFQNLVPKLVRNLSNSIATFSLIFAKNTSNSSLDRKMELLIKKSVYRASNSQNYEFTKNHAGPHAFPLRKSKSLVNSKFLKIFTRVHYVFLSRTFFCKT